MRRAILLGSVLLLAGGCSQVAHADGAAGPVTSVAPPSPSVSSAAPVTVTTAPTPAKSTSAPAKTGSVKPSPTSTATSHRPVTSKVLGPNGFGALKLGMTIKTASVTGLIGGWSGTVGPDCGARSHLLGGHGASAGNDGTVLAGSDIGVEIIDAYPGVSTPEGIHIGSTEAALYQAYPNWKTVANEDPHADGRGLVPVPGNSNAYYRIVKLKGQVVQLTLQFRNQGCYE